jgi:amino acid transporter
VTTLARTLRPVDYFTLGWGAMVGVGWLVVMDDWLGRGGPVGAMVAFAIGGALLLPVGWVYGRLVAQFPDAAGEVAYTARVFPRPVSFATGWMMFLAYLVVCPWEAVAVGRIAAYLFPAINCVELYRVADKPVYLPPLIVGLGLTLTLTLLNYRGIRQSAVVQAWTTFSVLALFVVFVAAGVANGSAANLDPPLAGRGWVSVLLVLQVVPYFMTGFESAVKGAEEARPELRSASFSRAILAAILVGIFFYVTIIGAVGLAAPWQALLDTPFLTAAAFERATGSRWVVVVILATALLSLVKVFNGNFVAASRLLFGLGRHGLLTARVTRIHPAYRSPSTAVVVVGVTTAAATLLGQAILVPIAEVGSVACAVGWLAACGAHFCMKPPLRERLIAAAGMLVGLALILMKALPVVPGHFDRWEWLALALWCGLGVLLLRPAPALSDA